MKVADLQAEIKLNIGNSKQQIDSFSKQLVSLNEKLKQGIALTREEERYKNQLISAINKEKKSRDSITKELEKQIRAIEKANNQNEKSSGIWSKLSTRITVAGLAVNAITKSIGFLTSALSDSAREAILFQKNMSLSNTILDVSKDKINAYSGQVAQMGVNLGKAPSELAMGLYDVASSTDSTVDRLHVLEIATKASVAGFTDVSTAVDSGIGMMNAFGLGVKDLDRIYDLQFKTVDRGIIKYGELKESLGNMMSSANNAKVPMEEMLGQLAFLTRQGQNYAKASVALARTYDTVFEKGDKLKKYLDVDVADSNGKLRITTDILSDMAKELAKFDEISQVNILEEIGFTDRASRGIISMMANVEGVRKEIGLVTDGAGSMEQAFIKASDNIATEWTKMKVGIYLDTYKFMLENEESIRNIIKLFGQLAKFIMFVFGNLKKNIDLVLNVFTLGAFKNLNQWTNGLKEFFGVFKNSKEEVSNVKEEIKDLNVVSQDMEKLKLADQLKADKFKTETDKIVQAFEDLKNGVKNGKISIGEDMKSMLTFYQNFTDGMSLEVKKQIAVTAALGQAKSVIEVQLKKWKDSGYTPSEKETSALWGRAKGDAETTYNTVGGVIGLNTATGRKTWDNQYGTGKSGGGSTGNSSTEQYSFQKELDKFKEEMSLKGISLNTEEYYKAFKSFLESNIDNVQKANDKASKEFIKTSLSETNASLGKIEFDKKIDSSIKDYQENIVKERKKLEEDNAKAFEDMVKDSDDYNNDIIDSLNEEYKNTLEAEDERQKTLEEIMSSTDEMVKKAKALGEDTTTKEFKESLLDSIDQKIEQIYEMFKDVPNVRDALISKLKSTSSRYYSKGNKVTTTDEANKKQQTLNENLDATTELFGELGSVLENDFLNQISNTINGVTSIIKTLQSMNAGTIGGLAGGLGIATAVIGIAGTVASELDWFTDVNAEAQAKANEAFQQAVDDFQSAIDEFSIGEQISYAQLTRPSELSTVSAGTGSVEGLLSTSPILSGLFDSFGWGTGASNATADLSGLKSQLTGAGYTDLASQLDSILGNYAQYSSYTDWSDWGKKKSYISGYDTTGFMTEVNKLIDEAWKKNLENYKSAIGLTTDAFASTMEGVIDGGDFETSLAELYSSALKTSFLNQKAFENVYSAIGTSMTDLILQQMGSSALTTEQLATMSLSEQVAYLKQLMSTWTDVQSEAFAQAGLSAELLADSLNEATASSKNLPSVLKIVTLENLATQGYNSSSVTIQGNVYGNREFINQVSKAVNDANNKRTNN